MENMVASGQNFNFVFMLERLKTNSAISEFVEEFLMRGVLAFRSLILDRVAFFKHRQAELLRFPRGLRLSIIILLRIKQFFRQIIWIIIRLYGICGWDFVGLLSYDVIHRIHSFPSFVIFNLLLVLADISVFSSWGDMAIRIHVYWVIKSISVLLVRPSHQRIAPSTLWHRQPPLLTSRDVIYQLEKSNGTNHNLNFIYEINEDLNESSDQEEQLDSIVNWR